MIAFVGSVFSPYYHWAGRRDPDDHVCINVALYRPDGNRWSMTERGRRQTERNATSFQVGPSAIRREGADIIIDFDEVSVPRPLGSVPSQTHQGINPVLARCRDVAGFQHRPERIAQMVAGLAYRADHT
ncbi:hypothetical protein OEG86_11175 [Hoeflea alexandrii]|uniref:hypothetical protein n=1 Tax=Hoeflea alexandrii TaxID=288436 RepID=UPI00226F6868|nr:hypothetical protein [Hoeflea alexandrii]MCY0152700.1 hypothetical protein [Hoeflea alexandrii]